jgi:hypothetical protein
MLKASNGDIFMRKLNFVIGHEKTRNSFSNPRVKYMLGNEFPN